VPGPRWSALAAAIDGEVDLRGSPEHTRRARTFNARFDQLEPEAIVRCATPDDVAETVRFVARHGLAHATRAGGHSFAGHSSTTGTLVDVAPLHHMSVSADRVRAGGGVRLGELSRHLDTHGVAVAAGTCPEVGLAGLALGGGLGILGRTHGVTSDQLLSAQVVLADGRIVECDSERHTDLFWALRGAGAGNFGVVTELELATVAAPPATSFHLSWPASRAAAVIDAWQRWAPNGPEELAASLKITGSGPPDRPLSVDLYGTLFGAEGDARDLLEELVTRARSDPMTATHQYMSYPGTRAFWADLGEPATTPGARPHLRARSEFFNRYLPAEAIEELLRVFAQGRATDESRELDFMPWGGAYNRRRADATAFVHRDETFILKHAVTATAPERGDVDLAHRWVDASWATVHPWGSKRVFQNFADPDLTNWAHAYYGPNLPRLGRVKSRYDPTGFFRHAHTPPGA